MKWDDQVRWSGSHYQAMADGCIWAVPRAGLIFTKKAKENVLILTERMPYTEELVKAARRGLHVPNNAEELEQFQNREFESIAARFRAAGIEVRDESKKPEKGVAAS